MDQHSTHARAVALFAGLATAFFVFALQTQHTEQALSQATARLTMSAEQMELWRSENVQPDGAMRRSQRGLKGETALRARLRALTRRQDRQAEQMKEDATSQEANPS